jgi:NAD(P)-dependent dehydrogenase (short-subunit alcohol dehydrogenase family)
MLQDKVVLVTGAGAGIGRAIALMMAGNGASVAAADIDLAAAQRTAAEAAGNNRRAIAIEADCGDVGSIDRMIERTVAELGRLERAAREMIKQHEADGSGGRIINIASISGRGYAGASNAAYAASKGAVISLTKMAAQQLGRFNINVNAVCPGVTRTELGARNSVTRAAERGISVEQMQAEQEAQIPIRRANTPDDIAAMALFLASPGARNVTGQSYNVDGGLVPS